MHKSSVDNHLKSWKATFRRAFEADTRFGSLSASDQMTVLDVMVIWISICFDVMSNQTSSDAAMAFFSNLKSVAKAGPLSYFSIISDCQAIDAVLLRQGRLSKRDVRDKTCCGWLRKLLYHYVDYSFRDIHQILSFCKRVTVTSDPDLETATEASYFDNLERVAKVNAAIPDVSPEREVITRWAKTFQPPKPEDYQFGNGQVSWNLKNNCAMKKFAQFGITSKGKYFSNHFDDPFEESLMFGKIPRLIHGKHPENQQRPMGALTFVPKSYKTYRPICMEDLQLSYYQQGILRAMARWFKTIPGRPIDMTDQERSMALARIGSIHPGTYATIDLSSASDSVSRNLVWKLVSGIPALRDCLFATRSSAMTYKGQVYELPMFAAMGSACCFPVECLVFASVVQAVVDSVYGVNAPCVPHWYVYGDDIICETSIAPRVIQRLQELGFIVNTEKSYYTIDSYFREACGGEYYHGENVIPVRVGRQFQSLPEHRCENDIPCTLEPWFALANALAGSGFAAARRYVIYRLALAIPRKLLPWSNRVETIAVPKGACDASGICGTDVSSSRLYTPGSINGYRWDADLQRLYRFEISSESTQGSYFSIRGKLLASLAYLERQGEELDPPCFGVRNHKYTIKPVYE